MRFFLTFVFCLFVQTIVEAKGGGASAAASTAKEEISPQSTNQTDRVVTGKITDEAGEAIIGASVMVKGTSKGTSTNADGEFSLEVPAGATLSITYLGYLSQEIAVGNQRVINVTLAEDTKALEEVVVIGYGTIKKSDLTGAVSKISTDELTQLSTIDIGQAIAGRAAGVDVVSNSGQPGSGNKIRIRGYGTINSSDPLYIVDGFPASSIDFISPQDIESLEILKDASATAIYGSRGANGVILIKTKGGRYNTRTSINATIYGSMSQMTKKIDLLNAWQYATLKKELYQNSGMTLSDEWSKMFDFVIQNKYEGTDWQSEVARTGYTQNYNVDVNGGTDRQIFGLGATYSKTQGILKFNNLDVLTLRLNNTYKLNLGITLGANIIYNTQRNRGGNGNGSYYGSIWPGVMRSDPIMPAYDWQNDNWGEMIFSDSSYQPARQIYLASAKYNQGSTDMFVGNFSLQIDDIASIKGLGFRSQYGKTIMQSASKSYYPVWYVSADQNNPTSRLSLSRTNMDMWMWNGYLMYNQAFGQHSINSTLGMEMQKSGFSMVSASGQDIPEDPDRQYLDQTDTPDSLTGSEISTTPESMLSYFYRLNYTFANKYLFTGTVRIDGSSKFAKGNKYGTFPSFSLGWNLHEESFMKNVEPSFNQLKLRAGWGQVGNSASAGTSDVYSMMIQGYNAAFGDQVLVGAIQEKLSNPELQWEAAEQLNFAVDFALSRMRFTGTIDYFIRTTRDMILASPIPMYVGNTRPNVNLGEMQNKGLEITLRWNDRIGNDFNYSLSANASFIKNKVLALGSPDPIYGANIDKIQQPFTRTEVGKEMAYFYGFKTDGIFQSWDEVNNYTTSSGQLLQPNAAPGDVRFVKTADDGLPINNDDRVYLGSGMADATFGFNATAGYKGFDFSLFMQSSVGNEIANAAVMDLYNSNLGQWNMSANMMDRWTPEKPSNKYPRLIATDPNNNSRFSDRYVEDGSYLRIKNVQIGYTIPTSLTQKFKIQRLRIYGSVDNLCVFTKYSGFDPEMGDYIGSPLNNGIDLASYPRPRVFVLGFNITL